jgi:hypothetical protein
MWIHKVCRTPIEEELRYTDGLNDYHFPYCPVCEEDVEMKDAEWVDEPDED